MANGKSVWSAIGKQSEEIAILQTDIKWIKEKLNSTNQVIIGGFIIVIVLSVVLKLIVGV
jgi:hypothetical protein